MLEGGEEMLEGEEEMLEDEGEEMLEGEGEEMLEDEEVGGGEARDKNASSNSVPTIFIKLSNSIS
jgi:hypothetical protein